MIKIPYGISNFELLIESGCLFIDRTSFIERLENLDTRYNFFLRPRRFGKSLFVSLLGYYYGVEHKDKFNSLFGKCYIGSHPTPKANAYLVLNFDFSRIDTRTEEGTFKGFVRNVRLGVSKFLDRYPHLCTLEERKAVLEEDQPAGIFSLLASLVNNNNNPPIYLLIDEYDHFTNELIGFNLEGFKNIVSRNGFVRKFYEAIKTATFDNIVERLFITGVTPVTLDSLTSGFNIRTDLSRNPRFNEMMGFTAQEVQQIMESVCDGRECDMPQLMADLKKWYNGYSFSDGRSARLYNPDMVLYFASEFKHEAKYPKKVLDTNIASDYSKISNLFHLQNSAQNFKVLEALVKEGEVLAEITAEFSFEKEFSGDDFASLLYYLGFLTIKEDNLSAAVLVIPNYVIWKLYVGFFAQRVAEQGNFSFASWEHSRFLIGLAQRNEIKPFIEKMEETLAKLSNRDALGFTEKHIKLLFVSLINMGNVFYIKSEQEVGKKYVDILLLNRPPIFPNYQFAIEFKYLHKKEEAKAQATFNEAKTQLLAYLERDELKSIPNLKRYVIVFVGDDCFACEEV